MEVASQFDIFVMTVSTFGDKRLDGWTKAVKISTILVDESAQLNEPYTVCLLAAKPIRIIFVGPHLQLRPTVLSVDAVRGGFNRSLMEWLSQSK